MPVMRAAVAAAAAVAATPPIALAARTMLAELLPCSVDPHILAAHPRFMVALAGVVLTVAVAVWKGVVALVDLFLGSNTARLTFGVLEWLWVTLVGFWSWSGNSSSSN